MGSVFADMYNGGGNLCKTMVLGRFASQNAAKRAKGEFQGATEKALTHAEKLAAAQAEEEAQKQLDVSAVPNGVYEGEGRGFGGAIRLSITVESGEITNVEVIESSETASIGALALPNYCQTLVDEQDVYAIDVAAGASNTLHGFKEAVEKALS